MQVLSPEEAFPELGTVANPAVIYDGNDAFVCYEASNRAGGGNVVIKFGDVIDFRITPVNVEGLKDCRYPVDPWTFNEITQGAETRDWKALKPRFWLISFNDITIEVLFETVSLVSRDAKGGSPHTTLIGTLLELNRGGSRQVLQ
ncbi:hypothetical protein IFT56_18835 [Rhizobium sp. CFBP 13717]|nr:MULTISPECIES: hypothetical protein [unclassified Rhizobium]MBD8686406.1 hypothetical protein [Rhizobium sp. CFBP 13644]MBD8693663.1 hypothetical protein [Rhizobium sp. CFBP 13717]